MPSVKVLTWRRTVTESDVINYSEMWRNRSVSRSYTWTSRRSFPHSSVTTCNWRRHWADSSSAFLRKLCSCSKDLHIHKPFNNLPKTENTGNSQRIPNTYTSLNSPVPCCPQPSVYAHTTRLYRPAWPSYCTKGKQQKRSNLQLRPFASVSKQSLYHKILEYHLWKRIKVYI